MKCDKMIEEDKHNLEVVLDGGHPDSFMWVFSTAEIKGMLRIQAEEIFKEVDYLFAPKVAHTLVSKSDYNKIKQMFLKGD